MLETLPNEFCKESYDRNLFNRKTFESLFRFSKPVISISSEFANNFEPVLCHESFRQKNLRRQSLSNGNSSLNSTLDTLKVSMPILSEVDVSYAGGIGQRDTTSGNSTLDNELKCIAQSVINELSRKRKVDTINEAKTSGANIISLNRSDKTNVNSNRQQVASALHDSKSYTGLEPIHTDLKWRSNRSSEICISKNGFHTNAEKFAPGYGELSDATSNTYGQLALNNRNVNFTNTREGPVNKMTSNKMGDPSASIIVFPPASASKECYSPTKNVVNNSRHSNSLEGSSSESTIKRKIPSFPIYSGEVNEHGNCFYKKGNDESCKIKIQTPASIKGSPLSELRKHKENNKQIQCNEEGLTRIPSSPFRVTSSPFSLKNTSETLSSFIDLTPKRERPHYSFNNSSNSDAFTPIKAKHPIDGYNTQFSVTKSPCGTPKNSYFTEKVQKLKNTLSCNNEASDCSLRSIMGPNWRSCEELSRDSQFSLEPKLLKEPLINIYAGKKFERLNKVFKCLRMVCDRLHLEGKPLLFETHVKKSVSLVSQCDFSLSDLARIMWVLPGYLDWKWYSIPDPANGRNGKLKWDIEIIDIKSQYKASNEASENTSVLTRLFRSVLVFWISRKHEEFLLSMKNPIVPPSLDELQQWNEDFNPDETIMLPEKKLPNKSSQVISKSNQSSPISSHKHSILDCRSSPSFVNRTMSREDCSSPIRNATTPNRIDTTSNRIDTTPNRIDTTPNRIDTSPNRIDTTSRLRVCSPNRCSPISCLTSFDDTVCSPPKTPLSCKRKLTPPRKTPGNRPETGNSFVLCNRTIATKEEIVEKTLNRQRAIIAENTSKECEAKLQRNLTFWENVDWVLRCLINTFLNEDRPTFLRIKAFAENFVAKSMKSLSIDIVESCIWKLYELIPEAVKVTKCVTSQDFVVHFNRNINVDEIRRVIEEKVQVAMSAYEIDKKSGNDPNNLNQNSFSIINSFNDYDSFIASNQPLDLTASIKN